MKCEYGCGKEGKYKQSNGKVCCELFYSQCSEIRRKNTIGLKRNWNTIGRISSFDFSSEVKYKMGSSNRGKTILDCEHIKRKSETTKKRYKEGIIKASFIGRKHSSQTKRKQREAMIRHLIDVNDGRIITPTIGKIEKVCLNELQKYCKYYIIRQHPVIGFWVDGYIKDLNLVIEFDESFHEDEIHIVRDKERQKDIENELTCIFFRIKEKDWKISRESVLQKFKDAI